MGKRMRARLQAREAQVATHMAVLGSRQNFLVVKADRGAMMWSRFEPGVRAFRNDYLRPPSEWVYKGKSSDIHKVYRSFLQFVFCRYRVPHCLEQFWIEEDARTNFCGSPLPGQEAPFPHLLPQAWYIIAGRGGSLYGEGGKTWLSRKEVHHLLADSGTLALPAAIVHAVALAESANRRIAATLAASKIATRSLFHDKGFHETVHAWIRFLARTMKDESLNHRQIDDLTDYYDFARQSPGFDLKGRKIPALRKAMVAWHHDLARQRGIRGGMWPGLPIADQAFVTGPERRQAEWRMHQITTGDELYEEGRAQRHCVAGYKRFCMEGDCAIFSLTCREPLQPDYRRQVTLEVRRGTVVQARRFANGAVTPQDMAVISVWAAHNGLTVTVHL